MNIQNGSFLKRQRPIEFEPRCGVPRKIYGMGMILVISSLAFVLLMSLFDIAVHGFQPSGPGFIDDLIGYGCLGVIAGLAICFGAFVLNLFVPKGK